MPAFRSSTFLVLTVFYALPTFAEEAAVDKAAAAIQGLFQQNDFWTKPAN